MISAQDKQAILDGEYGITRDGMKCKYLGRSKGLGSYDHFFVYYDKDGLVSYTTSLTRDFINYIGSESVKDVVGLWKNRTEPFNLHKALAGAPVMTRDGSKAYVQATISQEKELEHYRLIGFGFNG